MDLTSLQRALLGKAGMLGRAGCSAGAEFGNNTMSLTHHLNCFRKMLRFRLFLGSRKVT